MKTLPDDLDLQINVPVTEKNPHQIAIFIGALKSRTVHSVFMSFPSLELVGKGHKQVTGNGERINLLANDVVVLSPGCYSIAESADYTSTLYFLTNGLLRILYMTI